VFAPSNEAFAAYLLANNLTTAQLLAAPSLGNILKFHVVHGVAAKVSVICTCVESFLSIIAAGNCCNPIALQATCVGVPIEFVINY